MPLSGLRSFPMPVDPWPAYQAGIAGYENAQKEEEQDIHNARQRLLLLTEKQDAAEKARKPQVLTLGSPAVPPGLAATPQAGEDPESRAFLPRTQGVPARTETLTEFPREQTPLQFAETRRRTQARVDAQQAMAEADDRAAAGDAPGQARAMARSYGHWMDAEEARYRPDLLKQRTEQLNRAAKLDRRQAGNNPDLARLWAAGKASSEHPEDLNATFKFMEVAASIDDEDVQPFALKWSQDLFKESMQRRDQGVVATAMGKVRRLMLEKETAVRKKNLPLDEDAHRQIALEVMQEAGNEVGIVDRAIMAAKGTASKYFMELYHQELEPKDYKSYQEAAGRGLQAAREQYGANATDEQIRAKIDEQLSMIRTGQTPAAQKSKQDLQAAQAERARAGADALERKAMQEASVGGGLNMGRVTPGTIKSITSAIKDIDTTMAAISNDATKSQQEKDQEVMTWEQSKTRLHGLLDRISQAQLARPSGAAAPAVSASRPAAATAPSQPPPAAAALAKRIKARFDAGHLPGEDLRDPKVLKKYQKLLEGSTP